MKSKTKILIVDDELINLEFFGVMLSKLGFTVEKAEDGEEALEKTKAFMPDLIILDNIMPKLSGWEVTKILKQEEAYSFARHIPIIMLSAMDDVKDKIEGFTLGVEDYITKPFNFSEVYVRIKAVLRNKDMVDQITHREKRLEVGEALAAHLVDCVRKLSKPLKAILRDVKKLDSGNAKAVGEFLERFVAEGESCVEVVKDAEKKISEAEAQHKTLKEREVSIKDIEEKYRMEKDGLQG